MLPDSGSPAAMTAGGDQHQEPPRLRESDGWQILSYMLGGMILYGGIGWLIGHWTGISILFPLGMILGIGLSVAMIIFRFTRS
jgi:F0F1-type ATP synthase assembly protein I